MPVALEKAIEATCGMNGKNRDTCCQTLTSFMSDVVMNRLSRHSNIRHLLSATEWNRQSMQWNLAFMLGGWVNPHREQQTIPQGQTSIPPKSFSTPTANGQSAPWSGSARGVGRGAGSHTPSTASESFSHSHSGIDEKRPTEKFVHDIAVTKVVWCTAYGRKTGEGSYTTERSCTRIALVWAMQVGGAIPGWLTSARQLWSERISCKGQSGMVRLKAWVAWWTDNRIHCSYRIGLTHRVKGR